MTGTCRHGHPRAEHSYRGPNGKLRCRACQAAANRAAWAAIHQQWLAEHADHQLRTNSLGAVRCTSCFRRGDIDQIALDRVRAGHPVSGLTTGEGEHATRVLTRDGASAPTIAALIGRSERTVVRYRARIREAA